MATKKLEQEFVKLKKEFITLQDLIHDVVEKHSDLEKKYEKSISKKKKANFKCRKCGDKFENVKGLQKHKQEHCKDEEFKCDECEQKFKTQEKLEDHKSQYHAKYECDECEKVLRYEAILEKHVEAVHEDITLYCHYYNNEKECPFDDECIYKHEESDRCKYDSICERKLCMFRHEEKKGDDNENTDDEDRDDEEDSEHEIESIEDIKPMLNKFKKAVENFEELLQKCSLKCKECEFEAKDVNGLNMHEKAKHKNVNKGQ